MGVPFGWECSAKLSPEVLMTDRALVGWRQRDLPLERWLSLLRDRGLPAAAEERLRREGVAASALGLGVEAGPQGLVHKAYLEFWDAVCADLRSDPQGTPRCLHLGVKWLDAGDGRHTMARYDAWPLLSPAGIARRLSDQATGSPSPQAHALASDWVQRASRRIARGALLYMEAREDDNPRRSFDIQFYASGWRLRDVEPDLDALSSALQVPTPAWQAWSAGRGDLPLGHLAGGTDRHGQAFVSVYLGIAPLPA